jgi:hypothetical protein
MSACGTKRTFEPLRLMSAWRGKADLAYPSNSRPVSGPCGSGCMCGQGDLFRYLVALKVAPPRSMTKSRRLIRSPRRRGRVASGARRGRVPWRSWVPLNKSLLVGHHGERSSITPQSVRVCMTAATIEASTGPQIRNRAPVLNSTSLPATSATRLSAQHLLGPLMLTMQPAERRAVAGASETAGSLVFRPRERPPTQLRQAPSPLQRCAPSRLLTISGAAEPKSLSGLRLRHWIVPNIQYLNLSITWGELLHKEAKA